MVSSRTASEHASKKVQEKGTAALFNATAPFWVHRWDGFVAGERSCWRLAARKALVIRRIPPTLWEIIPHGSVFFFPYGFRLRDE